MRKLILLLMLACFIQEANAQAPTWAWSMSSGGGANQYPSGLVTSKNGTDIYMSGRYAGAITLGGKSLSAGGSTPFYGKFDGTGAFSTLVSYTGFGSTYPNGIARDTNDNIYTAGNIGSNAGLWVDKWNSSLVRQWGTSQSGGAAAGYVVAADNFGNVYTAGHYGSSFSIAGSPALPSYSGYDLYLAKTNSAGTVLWSIAWGGTGWDRPGAMVTDSLGNVYICGSFSAAGTIYSRNSASSNVSIPAPAAGSANLFVAKLDSSGKVLSVATATGAGFVNNDWPEKFGMIRDPYGNIYVTGYYTQTATFGTTSFTSKGNYDFFIAKLLPNGTTWEWAKTGGGTQWEGGRAIAFDENYDLYVTGFVQSTTADGGATYGGVTLNSAYSNDVFVAKYNNSTGNTLWALSAGGSSLETGWAITVDKLNNVYVAGDFGPSALTLGSTPAITAGSTGNIFIGKLNSSVSLKLNVTPAAVYCAGATTTLPYTISGTYTSGNIFTAQLSDANGSFANPVNIGTATATTAGNINITIPAGTTAGSNYLIRIISSAPSYSSFDYGQKVTISAAPTVSITPATTTTFCSGGSVSLTASGSTGTYSWAPNTNLSATTGATVTANPTGTVTYTVSSTVSGCTGTATQVVTVNALPTISVSPSTASAVCAGGNIALTASGAGSGGTYTWLPNTTLSAGGVGATVTATPTATVTYTVTGKDANNCTSTATKQVTYNTLPTISVSPSTASAVCAGGNVSLTASGAGSGGTYAWLPNTTLSAGGIGATVTATPTATVTYTVTGTDVNNCSSTATKQVTYNTLPTVSINPSTTIAVCNGQGATLSTTGSTATYSWAPNNGLSATTGASVTATPTGTVTYTVTATDANTCTNTATKLVTVNQLPPVAVSPSTATAICNGGNVALTASGATTYTWAPSTGLSATTGTAVTASPTGTITYTITGSDGTCSKAITKQITVNNLPSVNINPTTAAICIGENATLTASGASTYSWGPATGLSTTTGATVIASPTTTSTYLVTGTDGNSCVDTETVVVTVNQLPSVTVTPSGATTFCEGGNVTLSVPTGSGYTYKWQKGAIDISAATNSIYTATATGAYRVIVHGAGTCIDTSTDVSVTVNPLPNPVITANGAVMTTGSFAQYQWNFNGQAIANAKQQTHKSTQDGSYTVTVTDANGCSNTSAAFNMTKTSVPYVNGLGRDILIYPNPANGMIHINAPIAVNVSIYGMDGREVVHATDARDIDVSNIAVGIYILRVMDTNGELIKTEKLLKQ